MNCELISEQGEYRLTLPEGSVKCGQSSNGSVCCRVAVAETVTVPPGTEMLVPGMYVEPTGVTGPGVLEVAAKFLERSQLLVAKSLVNMEQAQVPLRLLNPKRKKGVTPKLQRPWDGPYLVIKRISDVVYRIQKSESAKAKVVSFEMLKPFKGTGEVK